MNTFSPSFFQALISNTTDLYAVIGADGKYVFVGNSVERLLGYRPHELVGLPVGSFVHPEDVAIVSHTLSLAQQQQECNVPPLRFRNKAGDYRWLECITSNMLGHPDVRGIVTNARDITDTMEYQALEEKSKAHYQALFFDHPDAVFTLCEMGLFMQANCHMAAITGEPEQNSIGAHFSKYVHPDYLQQAQDVFAETLQGCAQSAELQMVDVHQQVKELSVTLIPVLYRGKVSCVQGIAHDITQEKADQQQVRQQAQQLNSIIESITEPFFALDNQHRFTFVTQAFAELVHVPRESLVEKTFWETLPQSQAWQLHPKLLEARQTNLTQYFEEEMNLCGRKLSLQFSLYPSADGVAVYIHDQTEQKNVQEELEKLSLVASKTTNSVIITDSNASIEWVNDGFTRLTGYTLPEALGQKPGELLQRETINHYDRLRFRHKLDLKQPFSEEVLNTKKNGEQVWIKMEITPVLNNAGEVQKYVAIQSDISEQKEAEEKLLKLADDLYMQNRDLQQFAYILSHNMRAPVANAIGLAHLLHKKDKMSPSFGTTLAKLDETVSRLDEVMRDVSQILAIRNADLPDPQLKTDLKYVCAQVLDRFRHEIEKIDATFTLAADDAQYPVQAQEAHLYNIVQHLVSNAIKFRQPGQQLQCHLHLNQSSTGCTLSVKDNGTGLDTQTLKEQLFKLYTRFHSGIAGKGMGLYLVKTQVEALGGTVALHSKPNEGTTVQIEFNASHV